MKKINFGVLVYQNQCLPECSSVNVGDYIQSLAALNIYKKIIEEKFNTSFGIDEFINLVLENNIDGFNFVFIKRDNLHEQSQYQGLDNIITIMNGWWMWPFNKNKELSFDIPKNLKPIFTSFHIYDNNLLNEKNIKTFEKFQPIGCRDIDTLNKLKSKNIDCFFSGCLTTTIDFYKWEGQNSDSVLLVDYHKNNLNTNESRITHHTPEIKEDFKKGLKLGLRLLKKYSLCKKVYTSRLHCYLPCLAMGVPVQFNYGDNSKLNTWGTGNERFKGLRELKSDQDKLSEIQLGFKEMMNRIKI
jgi:hypothetical protein